RPPRAAALPTGPLALHARDYPAASCRRRAGTDCAAGSPPDLRPLSMASKKRHRYIVGVDLGGTNIVAGAMSEDGAEHYGMRSIPTSSEQGADAVADRIVGLVEGVILDTIAQTDAHRPDFIGVGVGAPGPLDRERGVVIVAPNLGWRDFPLLDRIRDHLGMEATLDNDANCATVGEWWQGAAKGGRNVVGMTIGTGIGGGLIIDGQLFHGSSDVAGEIGHDTARYLGAGVANLLNTFNADVVVIAGGVTQAGDALFVPLRAEVRRRAFRPAVEAARIVPGALPGTAGVVGAVATFRLGKGMGLAG